MNRKALWLALSLSLPLGAAIATVSTTASADAPTAARAKAAAVAPTVTQGRFQRYLVSPRGDTMGLLLDGGTVRLLAQSLVRLAQLSLCPMLHHPGNRDSRNDNRADDSDF